MRVILKFALFCPSLVQIPVRGKLRGDREHTTEAAVGGSKKRQLAKKIKLGSSYSILRWVILTFLKFYWNKNS